jgi:hypothetical protein
MSYVNDLAELIARLAIELSETVPDTDLYEQRSSALAEWLKIFSHMVDSEGEKALG